MQILIKKKDGNFKVISKQYFGGVYQIEVINNHKLIINIITEENIANSIILGDTLDLKINPENIVFLKK